MTSNATEVSADNEQSKRQRCELAVNLEAVQQAAQRIAPHVHVTPVMTSGALDKLSGRQLFFKCEVFQKTGAFKYRGACNAIFSLSEEEAQKGVVTHSSGNHAAAVALAAATCQIPAYIVVPKTIPKSSSTLSHVTQSCSCVGQCKLDAIASHGAEIQQCQPDMTDREYTCARLKHATGAVFIPPYNHADVMAGQGTMALELLDQVPGGLDAIIVCVSGGGMISGVAVAAKGIQPDIVILAAEPSGTNDGADIAASVKARELVRLDAPDTIADGLRGRMGDKTWPVVRELVDDVIVVSEAEIVNAMQLCYERMKVVVEPSGAAGLAAALSSQFLQNARWKHLKRVGVILSGGNADLAALGLWGKFLGKA